MARRLRVGDKVRVTNNLPWEYFYPDNTGGRDTEIVIHLGEIGRVEEINIKDGVVYDEVCVSFSAGDGGLGCWYIHKAHLEIVL